MWQQFYYTFKATIDKKENLGNAQKVADLQGYLEELPVKCIESMTLSKENYTQALKQLKDRHGYPQVITSTNMSKLLKCYVTYMTE